MGKCAYYSSIILNKTESLLIQQISVAIVLKSYGTTSLGCNIQSHVSNATVLFAVCNARGGSMNNEDYYIWALPPVCDFILLHQGDHQIFKEM